jgi:hypothetical protein
MSLDQVIDIVVLMYIFHLIGFLFRMIERGMK